MAASSSSSPDQEIPQVPQYVLSRLGLNYVEGVYASTSRDIDPTTAADFDLGLTSFLVEITIDGTSRRAVIPVSMVNKEWCVNPSVLAKLIFEKVNRSTQTIKIGDAIKSIPQAIPGSSLNLVSATQFWGKMIEITRKNKKSIIYTSFATFNACITPDFLATFIERNTNSAIHNAICHMIKYASWQWPFYKNPTNEHNQTRALDDIKKIKDAIIAVKKVRPHIDLNIERAALGDFIKTIADFHNDFPNFS